MAKEKYIEIKGARANNLKNIDIKIPQGKFVAITGVSGSGKSSLAFDTLYAEGQRRYVESLSSYARQFLGRMSKPECDFIKGLPPAIAIEQKVISRNPRSTVGTTTEIYEYLRLLYARIGRTFSPISGEEVKRHTTEDVLACTRQYSPGTKLVILAPIHVAEGRTLDRQLEMYLQEGYSRILVKDEFVRIEDFDGKAEAQDIYLVIDRSSVSEEKSDISRLTDSTETAFYEGDGACRLLFLAKQHLLRLLYPLRGRRHHLRRSFRQYVCLQLSLRGLSYLRGLRKCDRYRRETRHPQHLNECV